MTTQVKARCKETRYVGHDKYFAGRDYAIDAVRAGKYGAYFEPNSLQDAEIVAREWGAVKEKWEAEQRYSLAQGDVARALEVLKNAGILDSSMTQIKGGTNAKIS